MLTPIVGKLLYRESIIDPYRHEGDLLRIELLPFKIDATLLHQATQKAIKMLTPVVKQFNYNRSATNVTFYRKGSILSELSFDEYRLDYELRQATQKGK